MVTIKLNQKHIERFVFIVIIIVLSGMLINEKYPSVINSLNNENIETNNLNNVENEVIEDIDVEENIQTTTTTTTTTTSTTTTTMVRDIIFEINDVRYERTDENSGRIHDFIITIKNGLSTTADIELRFYKFDSTNQAFQRNTVRYPINQVGRIEPNRAIINQAIRVDRNVFNLEHDKNIIIQIEDKNSGIIKEEVFILETSKIR